ncbi:MAG: phosphatase PAP2 family protein [Candidatus Aenigmatarchaeota archaeon]|nr:MAG: phosphatase PAP2 family protein [Candidatus Aenigmarchaeota archaeon]
MMNFWAALTLLGDPVIWSVSIIILILFYFGVKKKYIKIGPKQAHLPLLKKFLLLVIPVIIVSMLGSEILKIIFQMPRPCVPCPGTGCNPYCPVTFSFPSGHTSTITGLVTALFLVLRRNRYLFVYILVALVAASRVALGVHTVSDVIAGFFVGMILTMLVWRYRKKLYRWEDEIL